MLRLVTNCTVGSRCCDCPTLYKKHVLVHNCHIRVLGAKEILLNAKSVEQHERVWIKYELVYFARHEGCATLTYTTKASWVAPQIILGGSKHSICKVALRPKYFISLHQISLLVHSQSLDAHSSILVESWMFARIYLGTLSCLRGKEPYDNLICCIYWACITCKPVVNLWLLVVGVGCSVVLVNCYQVIRLITFRDQNAWNYCKGCAAVKTHVELICSCYDTISAYIGAKPDRPKIWNPIRFYITEGIRLAFYITSTAIAKSVKVEEFELVTRQKGGRWKIIHHILVLHVDRGRCRITRHTHFVHNKVIVEVIDLDVRVSSAQCTSNGCLIAHQIVTRRDAKYKSLMSSESATYNWVDAK